MQKQSFVDGFKFKTMNKENNLPSAETLLKEAMDSYNASVSETKEFHLHGNSEIRFITDVIESHTTAHTAALREENAQLKEIIAA